MANKIYVLTEYDLLSTKVVPGNYYFCTDSKRIYKDAENNTRIVVLATVIETEFDRLYNTKISEGKLYYVQETNVLWLYNAGWVVVAGNSNQSNGYYYSDGILSSIEDYNVIDNNGLLRDGSVVIRDINRIIKGRLRIDNQTNNLVISSYLGGGIQLLPNDSPSAPGALIINPRTIYVIKYLNTVTGEQFTSSQYTIIEEVLSEHKGEELDLNVVYQTLKRIDKCPPDVNDRNYISYATILRRLESTYINSDNYEKIDVVTHYSDGYAIYNGEFNTTDEIYVNKRYPLTTAQLQLLECTEETDVNVVFDLLKRSGLVGIDKELSDYTSEEIYEMLLHFKGTVYSNELPKYKVWHEGNLNPDDLILNREKIISILNQSSEPVEINVKYLSGKTVDDLALKDHVHFIVKIENNQYVWNDDYINLKKYIEDYVNYKIQQLK